MKYIVITIIVGLFLLSWSIPSVWKCVGSPSPTLTKNSPFRRVNCTKDMPNSFHGDSNLDVSTDAISEAPPKPDTDESLQVKEPSPLLDWVERQKARKGEYPLMKITPQIVHLLVGDTKLLVDQQKELVNYLASKMTTLAANAQTQQQTKSSLPKDPLPKIHPTQLQILYPELAKRYGIVHTLDPRDHYNFRNEREELGKAISLKEKLGISNPLHMVKPETVIKTSQLTGWQDDEIQKESGDWSLLSTHLIWLGLLFQNDADIRNLRSRREMINEPKYSDLKALYQAIELGTPM